jgi:hypothetical protein
MSAPNRKRSSPTMSATCEEEHETQETLPNVVTPTKGGPSGNTDLQYAAAAPIDIDTPDFVDENATICSVCNQVLLMLEDDEDHQEDNNNLIYFSCPICNCTFCNGCRNRVVTPFFCDLCFRLVCDDCAVNCEVCGKSTCNDSVFECSVNHTCE